MAYEIHIVRADSTKAQESVITLDEWQSLCANDPSLKVEHEVTQRNPNTGQPLVISERNSAFWTSPLTRQTYLFDYRKAVISFAYGDETIAKAKEIAQTLSATIAGDKGEAY